MIIKKYLAKTEEEAMKLAVAELGEDVVLMNSRTVKPKGLMRIFKSSKVEITVGKEDEEVVRKQTVNIVKDNTTVNSSNDSKVDIISNRANFENMY